MEGFMTLKRKVAWLTCRLALVFVAFNLVVPNLTNAQDVNSEIFGYPFTDIVGILNVAPYLSCFDIAPFFRPLGGRAFQGQPRQNTFLPHPVCRHYGHRATDWKTRYCPCCCRTENDFCNAGLQPLLVWQLTHVSDGEGASLP